MITQRSNFYSLFLLCLIFASHSSLCVHGILQLRRFESAEAMATTRVNHPTAQVTVPDGWKVISGGAYVVYYGSGQLLSKSFPIISEGSSSPIGWSVQSKDHQKADLGQVQALAVAMYDPSDEYEVHVATLDTKDAETDPHATVFLPEGYTLLGGGINVHWKGQGSLITASRPTDDLKGWYGAAKDHIAADPSTISVYAIGIRHKVYGTEFLGTRLVSQGSTVAPHPWAAVKASSGSLFVGGGGEVATGGVGNMLVDLIPVSGGHVFYASSKDHLESDPKNLTAYGIEVSDATYI